MYANSIEYGTFIKIDQMLGHKYNLKLRMFEVIYSMFGQ